MKKKLLALAAGCALVLGACGGDDGDTAEGTATTAAAAEGAAETTAAPATSAAPASSAAPATSAASATSAAAPTTAAPATAAGPVAVSLKEWSLEAVTSLKAGPQTFSVKNDGSFPHELAIIKGTYAALPQSSIGTVEEDQLAAGALIGRSDRINAGQTVEVKFDLPAGQYVLLCNISVGPNSHAGKGQRLDITVA